MASRWSFLKHYTHSNIQLNKVCFLWKYTEWCASSRSNGFQKNFFHTLYTFKHTIEQCMRSVKVHWVVGFNQKQWLTEEFFWNIIHMQTYNRTKNALCESTLSGGLQAEAMAFKGSFQNTIHIQTYNWTKYALCESTLSSGLQAEVMAFRRSFSKQYTHSNIQLNKVCSLWKHSEGWASSRSIGFQEKFFKTIYTFKHTIEKSNGSVKVQWVVGFKEKEWLSEEFFSNIIHIQTWNWTKYAFCENTLIGGLQAEAMGFRRSFSKHPTHSNIQLNNVWALWKYTEWLASSRSNASQKKFFETLYTFKHTIEQSNGSVKVQWVVGFKEKEWLSKEFFWNNIHIQTWNWRK